MSVDYSYEQIAKMIDHSLLNPVLTDEELERGCHIAREYNVASVCIKPYYLKRCAEILEGSSVRPCTTIGFPHGGTLPPSRSRKRSKHWTTAVWSWTWS